LKKLDEINEIIRLCMQTKEYFYRKGSKKAGIEEIIERLLPRFFCKKCDREITTEWKYCPNCGTQISEETVVVRE
jgi:hypothetical protein